MTDKSTIDRKNFSITFQRVIEDSRENVFDAWTQPDQLAAWWDPTGRPLERCEIDLRPGGSFRFQNQGGTPPFVGVYRTVERPAELVFEALGTTGRVELIAAGTATRMRVVISCASRDHLEQFLQLGVREDTERTLDNLVSRMHSRAASHPGGHGSGSLMRPTRLLLAVAAGTLTLFVWGAFSHLVLIRGVGFSALSDEPAVVHQLASAGVEPGLYAFPAPPDWRGEAMTDASTAAFEARFREGPSGLLVVRPRGEGPVSPRKILVQLGASLVAVLVAVFVASSLRGSFLRRAACIAAVGSVGLASVGVILWNWYAFTNAFFAALCLDVLGGWCLVGCVVAALLRPALYREDRLFPRDRRSRGPTCAPGASSASASGTRRRSCACGAASPREA